MSPVLGRTYNCLFFRGSSDFLPGFLWPLMFLVVVTTFYWGKSMARQPLFKFLRYTQNLVNVAHGEFGSFYYFFVHWGYRKKSAYCNQSTIRLYTLGRIVLYPLIVQSFDKGVSVGICNVLAQLWIFVHSWHVQ